MPASRWRISQQVSGPEEAARVAAGAPCYCSKYCRKGNIGKPFAGGPACPVLDHKESIMRNLIGDKLQNVYGRKDKDDKDDSKSKSKSRSKSKSCSKSKSVSVSKSYSKSKSKSFSKSKSKSKSCSKSKSKG
jgi:hypothetical protein